MKEKKKKKLTQLCFVMLILRRSLQRVRKVHRQRATRAGGRLPRHHGTAHQPLLPRLPQGLNATPSVLSFLPYYKKSAQIENYSIFCSRWCTKRSLLFRGNYLEISTANHCRVIPYCNVHRVTYDIAYTSGSCFL